MMSLKEKLGLRSHREDPKMFWFEMALLCLFLGVVGGLLSLARFSGPPGVAVSIVRGLGLSWAFLCALLTAASGRRKQSGIPWAQVQLENQILLFTAVLVLLEQLLAVFPSASPTPPIVLAGTAVYLIARIAGPKLRRKERFNTREILLLLACGVLAFFLLVPFLDMATEVLSSLQAPSP